MEIFNTTTKETIGLTLIDPKTNICCVSDFIGNTGTTDIKWSDENERYEADGENLEWWKNHCEEYQKASDLEYEWKKEASEELIHTYNNAIDVEFNYLPSAMITFIEDNPLNNIAEKEVAKIRHLFFEGNIEDGLTAEDNGVLLENMENSSFIHVQDIMDQETWSFSDGSYITRNDDMYYVGNDIATFEVEAEIHLNENAKVK
jgi:hypothetical protein